MAFNIHSVYRHIFTIWRQKRQKLFAEMIKPQPDDLVLDVGGYPSTWIGREQQFKRIDCLNIHPINSKQELVPSVRDKKINKLVGDGCTLEFDDQSYEIAFSNSVIEHVGDWSRQCSFAAEIRRVGKKLWVQTPAYECPIEPHFLAPFVHWIPLVFRRFIVRWLTPWGWIQRPSQLEVERMVGSTRLLTKAEMIELFPDCEIITERMLWIIPKSYIAMRTNSEQAATANFNSNYTSSSSEPLLGAAELDVS